MRASEQVSQIGEEGQLAVMEVSAQGDEKEIKQARTHAHTHTHTHTVLAPGVE